MIQRKLKIGEIVQVTPDMETFGSCFLVVTENKSFGVIGYVRCPGKMGRAYLRCSWDQIEPTGGMVAWEESHDATSE